jgi:hypothetical protein
MAHVDNLQQETSDQRLAVSRQLSAVSPKLAKSVILRD